MKNQLSEYGKKSMESCVKNCGRRVLAFFLALSLALAAALNPAQCTEAASIKLNKTKAFVLVGKSVRLSVSGTKKKVTWSSSSPDTASVSKGKVTGKKPGTAVICAKVAGKVLKCTIKVAYNPTEGNKKISKETKELYNGILIKYSNQNSYPVSIVTKLSYRDAAKTVISTAEEHNYCLEAGRSSYFYFPKPVDGNSNYVKYTDYTVSMKTGASKYQGCAADITQWCKTGTTVADVTAYNYSGKDLTAAKVSCLFYDNRGRLMAYMSYFPGCLKKGSHSEETLNYPSFLSNPSRVETLVDYAY